MTSYPPPPSGAPPSIEWIAPARLEVDAAYQRSTGSPASRRHIAAIAQAWDWRLCQPLAVSRRAPSGGLFVIDGQHRLEAARMRGDIAHLPCSVATFETIAEEAHLFVAANRGRRPMSRFDDHRAALAAGDATALDVDAVVRKAGLHIATVADPKAWLPGELGCLSGIRTAIRQHGRPVVEAALVNLAEAFPDERLAYAGTILRALYPILAKPPEPFDADRLFAALLTRTQQGWIDGLGVHLRAGDTAARELRKAILAAYADQPTEKAA